MLRAQYTLKTFVTLAPWLAMGAGLAGAGLSCGKSRANGRAEGGVGALLPAPVRPSDLYAHAHFGQPSATVAAAGRIAGAQLPLELGLQLVLGLDATVVSAIDSAQPMDAFVSGVGTRPDVVFVFVPGPDTQFRSRLEARYQFVAAPGLGQRLEPRAGRADALHCALVDVPGPSPARIVCANRVAALEHTGRFAAYESSAHREDRVDARIDIDAPASRAALLPTLEQAIQGMSPLPSTGAPGADSHNARAPGLANSEVAATAMSKVAHALTSAWADARRFEFAVTLHELDLSIDSTVELDPTGHSGFALDARSRLGMPAGHALTGLLAPDAIFVGATHSAAADRLRVIDALADSVLSALGARVSDPLAARADLHALFAAMDDEAAIAVAASGEVSLVFAQHDGGAAARSAIAQISHAAWLRTLRVGDTPVDASLVGGTLRVAPRQSGRRASSGGGSPVGSRRLVIAVVGNALAMVAGTQPEVALHAMSLRTIGPKPAVLATAGDASLVLGMDLAGLNPSLDAHPLITGSYSAAQEGAALTTRGHLTIPATALRAGRGWLGGR